VISIFGLIYSLVELKHFRDNDMLQIKKQQSELLVITSSSLDQKIGNITQHMNGYANQISNHEIKARDLGQIINHDLKINYSSILGVGVIFFDQGENIKHHRLYWELQNYYLVNKRYNKTRDDEVRWLAKSKQHPKRWSRPYYDKNLKQYVISYITTFYNSETHQAEGLIVLDIDLKSLVNLIAKNIGEKFTTVISDDGYYVYSTNSEKIVTRASLTQSNDNDSLIDRQIFNYNKAKPCLSLCHNVVNHHDIETYAIYQHLKNVPWLILAKFSPQDLELLSRTTDNSDLMIKIASITLIIICLGLMLIIRQMRARSQYKLYWVATAFVSLCFLTATVYTWNVSRNLYFVDASQTITSDHILQTAIKKYQKEASLKNLGEITQIPTAIMVDTAEFLTSYNLQLTGTIMQSYPIESGIQYGIKFNNAFDSQIKLISDSYTNNSHLLIWSFQTKIRENFDYKDFPFNHGKIWLSISPLNSSQQVIFTPNFSYYNGLSDINANYGVSPNIIVPGWLIKGSFFTFTNDDSRMIDEVDSYATVHLPALTFNMIINSTIGDAIITTITPPVVIILILFMVLLTISKHKNKFIEFKLSSIISSCSGVLFTIVFTHVSLRNKLTSEIMYIEYIYLLMYIVVIMIPVNAFLFAKTDLKPIRYGDNLIFKSLFILLTTGFIFAMTLYSFS